MNLWTKYKINNLPEEDRADAIKEIAKQEEETKRAKINSSIYNEKHIILGASVCVCLFLIALIGNCAYANKQETLVKTRDPVVCPPPPAPKVPAYNIKVTPAETAQP